jgi:hypothetical protein
LQLISDIQDRTDSMAGGLSTNGTGAPPQAGVLEGVNPIAYTPSNPITLFIVQAST